MNLQKILPLGLCILICFFVVSCDDGGGDDDFFTSNNNGNSKDNELVGLIEAAGVYPVSRPIPEPNKAALGNLIFFDKELSGNRDISCASCHPMSQATGDGLSLAIGTLGSGPAPDRVTNGGLAAFIPRNAPSLNERVADFTPAMFWDGRVSRKQDGSFNTPAGDDLLPGLDNALSAIDMFPATVREEMRGRLGISANSPTNELVDIPDENFVEMWEALTARFMAIPEYVTLFQTAYPEVTDVNDFNFTHIANALAEFEKVFTTFNSPFDRYIRGDLKALTEQQKRGALLFFGKANCASCHNGPFLSDFQVHNRVVPQLGPGQGLGPDGFFDFGKGGTNGNVEDNFKFRTPPLRNVARTGPWFHDGAFTTLEAAVRHELDPITSAANYDENQLHPMFQVEYHPSHTPEIIAAADPVETAPVSLTEREIQDLIAFLESLTSESIEDFAQFIPDSVPSGLPVED